MRIAIIGCMVMNREILHLVADSRHVVRVWWLRQGLHDTPDILRTELQLALASPTVSCRMPLPGAHRAISIGKYRLRCFP